MLIGALVSIVTQFLCRVADVLSDYFGGLNGDIIKDNFVIVYEVSLINTWLYFSLNHLNR